MSTKLDASTDAVARALSGLGAIVTRCDTETFPFSTRITTSIPNNETACPRSSVSTSESEPTSLDDLNSVWYRRVRVPTCPSSMDPGVYEFCMREGRGALIGTLLGGLPSDVRWMSRPASVWAAEHKVLQLTVARRNGLPVPETIVSNDAKDIRSAFARFRGAMIAKPVRTGYIEIDDHPHAIYTSRVLAEHLDNRPETEPSPAIYQPLLPKRCDVRATIVGDDLFVAEIESQSDPAARLDWRLTNDPELVHRRADLPPQLASALLRFSRDLGLTFGAADLVVSPEGEYHFLEINPNGQWLWLDDRLNLGITSAVAAWLYND